MAASEIAETERRPFTTQSTRDRWEILTGDDVADPILAASITGHEEALRSLLAQSQWSEIMFQEQLVIQSERSRPANGEEREVYVSPMTNIERAIMLGAITGRGEVVSMLLAFASQHGAGPSSVISREAINFAVVLGHAAVVDAFATAWPAVVTFDLHHERVPIHEAIRRKKPDVLEVLLRHGADPFWSRHHCPPLIVAAAESKDPRMIELLMERGVPLAGSRAIHFAAQSNCQDNIHFLMKHGLDVNEQDMDGNTPMHYAARCLKPEAMTFLEGVGGNPNARNNNGETPAELYGRTIQKIHARRREQESSASAD